MVVERKGRPIPQDVQDAALDLHSLISIDLRVLKDNLSLSNRNEDWETAAERHLQFAPVFKDFSDVMAEFNDAAKTFVSRYERLFNEVIGPSLSRSFGIGTPLNSEVQEILGIIVCNRLDTLTPDNFNHNDIDKVSEQLARELGLEDIDGNIDPDSSEKLTAKDVLCAVLQGKLKISGE